MLNFNVLTCLAVLLALVCASTQSNDVPDLSTTSKSYCSGTNFNQSLLRDYICGDKRLGPTRLPTHLPLDTLFATYDRFGGLLPGAFLKLWTDPTIRSYTYPYPDGFQTNTAGEPINGTITLPVGALLDRFGSEYGKFMSPAGAPFMQRSLPPSNLDNDGSDPRYPYNYHVYRVTRAFDVVAGPIAAYFGQPGQGVQYHLSKSVMDLLSGNVTYIERVDLKHF